MVLSKACCAWMMDVLVIYSASWTSVFWLRGSDESSHEPCYLSSVNGAGVAICQERLAWKPGRRAPMVCSGMSQLGG